MITRWTSWFRSVNRLLNRGEWFVRLLKLPKSNETAESPGIVLIQIDGLSRNQLEQALARRRMPRLKRLLTKEHYQLHTLYSGLPSSTPSVQGELFYGSKTAVPAFGFRDSQSGEIVRMVFPEPAARIQHELQAQGQGLLEGGSAYCNIYSGNAKEAHFCAATVGWGGFLNAANPLTLASLVLSYPWSLMRAIALTFIELVLAIVDCARGFVSGRDLWKEFQFVPARVVISVFLRELVAISTLMDIARGLPIIHLNLLGYDEQAHRRGPSSAFAHWSLHGVDRTINRIWHAARKSSRRHYDLWVYSDHGQEKVRPYNRENGRSVQEAVAAVFDQYGNPSSDTGAPVDREVQLTRASWLGGGRTAQIFFGDKTVNEKTPSPSVTVTASGPIGHVYPSHSLDNNELCLLAQKLVVDAHIPLVLLPSEKDQADAFTSRGKFSLPRDAEIILGKEHPFLEEAAFDLVRLCRHRDAGKLVLSGWEAGKPPISFQMENGAHAGPGSEETRAFALLPNDAPITSDFHKKYIRPLDLRRAVQTHLGRQPSIRVRSRQKADIEKSTIRIMTYNVHGCVGMDGKLSPGRIARVIAQNNVDVVALQELDVRRRRSGEVDQAHEIARDLEMEFHFHPAWQLREEQYGDAVLSRLPLSLVRSGPLPKISPRRFGPRGALWIELEIGKHRVQMINTHISLWPREQIAQVKALLGSQWLGRWDQKVPLILCGDFNSAPLSRAYSFLIKQFNDAQCLLEDHRPRPTYFSWHPFNRIDHVFLTEGINVHRVEIPQNELAKSASDHLPLITEISFNGFHNEGTNLP